MTPRTRNNVAIACLEGEDGGNSPEESMVLLEMRCSFYIQFLYCQDATLKRLLKRKLSHPKQPIK